MDCIEAQTTISEALDGTPIDADWLDSAKQHCRECADCGAFVRGLAMVKRSPLPRPPDDLPDRVMAAVRAEAAAEGAARNTRDNEGADVDGKPAYSADGSTDSAEPFQPVPLETPARRQTRTSPMIIAAWASAAAVFLVGMGALAVGGIHEMSSGSQSKATTANYTVAGAGLDAARAPAGSAAPQASPEAPAQSTSTDFVSFNGFAYRLVGPETISRSQVSNLGATSAALGSSSPRSREVMGRSGSPRIYLENDQLQLLAFEPVLRDYNGRSYRLTTGDIPQFGAWPSLAPGFTVPTSSDGAPTFVAVGGDPQGDRVFRLTAGSVADGIAIAPGSAPTDPAGGNPNWTWWTPAK